MLSSTLLLFRGSTQHATIKIPQQYAHSKMKSEITMVNTISTLNFRLLPRSSSRLGMSGRNCSYPVPPARARRMTLSLSGCQVSLIRDLLSLSVQRAAQQHRWRPMAHDRCGSWMNPNPYTCRTAAPGLCPFVDTGSQASSPHLLRATPMVLT
jgi:hypothetical protein